MSYEQIGKELGAMVDRKQVDYGDAFHRSWAVIANLYPSGVRPDQYQDMLAVVRIVDKLFRIATGVNEIKEDAYLDIAGYGLLGSEP